MDTYKEMYEQGKKAKTLKPITAIYLKWKNKGDAVLGRFIAKSAVTSQQDEGEYNQYLVETDEGLVKFSLGRSADNEIGAVLVKGKVYRIEFLGQENLTGGRRVNKFDCQEIGLGDEVVEVDETVKK